MISLNFHIRFCLAWLTSFIFGFNLLLAQDPKVIWMDVSNEFPTTAVDDIEQDQNGNLVFSNHLGVFIYDGLHYTNLTQQNGLSNSSIGLIDKDEANRLWFMSYAGKISYLEKGKMKELKAFNNSEYCGKYGTRLFFINTNKIVVDLLRAGIVLMYSYKKDKWVLEQKINFNPSKRLPIIRTNKEIGWLDYSQMNEKKTVTLKMGNYAKTVAIDPLKFSFFRSQENGITCVSIEKHLFVLEKNGIKHRQFEQSIGPANVGNNANLWISFLGEGIQEIDLKNLKNKGEILFKDQIIAALEQDQEGNLWFATTTQKLGMIPFSPFKKWNNPISIQGNLNSVFALNDTLFLGHINGDLGYFLPNSKHVETLFYKIAEHPDFESSNVRDFYVFKGKLYCISQNLGLFQIDRKTLAVSHLMKGIGISSAYNDGTNLYLASYNGVYLFDGNRFKQLTSNLAKAVVKTNEGELLIGQLDGLYTYNKQKLQKVKWPVKTDERVTSFAQHNNTTAIGFYGTGLIIKRGEHYLSIQQKDGLPSDFINSMLFNAKGQLVITTGNGIALITFQAKSKKGYVIQTIPGNECVDYDTYFVTEGTSSLFFSSYNGLLEVKSFVKNKRGNPLVMKKVRVNGKDYTRKTIKIPYNDRNLIELFYRQNTFTNSKATVYYYRSNKNKPWIQTDNESLILSELKPGKYEVEIVAKNQVNGFKSRTISQKIIIEPLLYQQIWFQVLVLLMLIGSFYWIIKNQLGKREQKRKLELEHQLEITRLEARALRSQMNPHFIFNALNSIQSFILKNDRDSGYTFLGKFAQLIREILENSKNEKISIEEEVHMLSNYLDLERMRENDQFSYEIIIDPRIQTESTYIPIMLLQPLVENAIVHGVSPLQNKKGEIKIKFELIKENCMQIIIRDNGIGRKASAALKQKKQHYHQSMGMEISEQRTNKQRVIDQASELTIIDLYSESGEVEGTEVQLKISLQHD